MTVRIPTKKIAKIGNGYCVLIPKALITCNVIDAEKRYDVELREAKGNSEKNIKKDLSVSYDLVSELENPNIYCFRLNPSFMPDNLEQIVEPNSDLMEVS